MSREPRRPGSVMCRSCGGAAALETKQGGNQSVEVKGTNTNPSWDGVT